MNCYQKIYGKVTLLFLAVTAMVYFVCFDAPYSGKFIVESIAVFGSEIAVGASVIAAARKNDRILFHVSGYPVCCMIYFFFTLIMSFFVNSDIQLQRFIAIHVIGFILLLILLLFFRMTEHNVIQQNTQIDLIRSRQDEIKGKIIEISIAAESIFSGDKELLQTLLRLADDCRYLNDPSAKTDAIDTEIGDVFVQLKESSDKKDKDQFLLQINHLQTLVKAREKLK